MGHKSTESPIEDALLDALQTIGDERVRVVDIRSLDRFLRVLRDDWQAKHIFVSPQVNLTGYRIDILMGVSRGVSPKLLAVECDGQQFHRANQSQVERDADRDAALLLMGIKTMRFSGKQIFNDQWRCARRAIAMIAPPQDDGFAPLIKSAPAVFHVKDDRWNTWKPFSSRGDTQ